MYEFIKNNNSSRVRFKNKCFKRAKLRLEENNLPIKKKSVYYYIIHRCNENPPLNIKCREKFVKYITFLSELLLLLRSRKNNNNSNYVLEK